MLQATSRATKDNGMRKESYNAVNPYQKPDNPNNGNYTPYCYNNEKSHRPDTT